MTIEVTLNNLRTIREEIKHVELAVWDMRYSETIKILDTRFEKIKEILEEEIKWQERLEKRPVLLGM